MGSSDETATSKLIEVLGRIDTTLEALDRRLQALEHSRQPLPVGVSASALVGGPKRTQTIRQDPLVLKYEVDQNEELRLQDLTIEDGDLLTLLSRVASPCLNRHEGQATAERKTISYPFTELLSYRDVLELIIQEAERGLGNELGSLFSRQPLAEELRHNVKRLLACLAESGRPDLERRDANLSRGVVLFDDLPTLFSPGTFLIRDEAGVDQVVEVSSCDIVAASATSETCVVETWHLRWDGSALSRTSSSFQLARYTGTRPINGLLYRPIIGPGVKESASDLESLLTSNKRNIEVLKELVKVEVGDYPVCDLFTPSVRGRADGPVVRLLRAT